MIWERQGSREARGCSRGRRYISESLQHPSPAAHGLAPFSGWGPLRTQMSLRTAPPPLAPSSGAKSSFVGKVDEGWDVQGGAEVVKKKPSAWSS